MSWICRWYIMELSHVSLLTNLDHDHLAVFDSPSPQEPYHSLDSILESWISFQDMQSWSIFGEENIWTPPKKVKEAAAFKEKWAGFIEGFTTFYARVLSPTTMGRGSSYSGVFILLENKIFCIPKWLLLLNTETQNDPRWSQSLCHKIKSTF